MCGRTRCTLRVEDVGRAAGFRNPLRTVDAERYRLSYNVAPGRYMPVVRHMQVGEATEQDSREPGPVVHCMKWGLVPSFTNKNEKPDHYRMFNARSESVRLKSTFSRLLKKNRCVVAVEGFYEWKKDGSKKQPYYLHFKDERPLVFAALSDSWRDEEGNVLSTFTILTTRNSKAIGWLHDRMPVILPTEDAVNSWLNDELTEASLHNLALPYEASDLVWYPVTPDVGKPSFDVPECVQEIKPKVAKESSIFQLFGKRKNMEISSQDDKEQDSENTDHPPAGKRKNMEISSQDDKERDSETTDHPPAGRTKNIEISSQDDKEQDSETTVVNDEDQENAEEKKALLACMQPDQDVTHALCKEEMDTEEPLKDSNRQNRDPRCNLAVKEEGSEDDLAVKREPYETLAVKEEVGEKGFAVHETYEEDFAAKGRFRGEESAVKGAGLAEDAKDQKMELSPGKETERYEPEAKKRRVSMSRRGSTKTGGKGGGKASLPNKQCSLHSFFGKK